MGYTKYDPATFTKLLFHTKMMHQIYMPLSKPMLVVKHPMNKCVIIPRYNATNPFQATSDVLR